MAHTDSRKKIVKCVVIKATCRLRHPSTQLLTHSRRGFDMFSMRSFPCVIATRLADAQPSSLFRPYPAASDKLDEKTGALPTRRV